MMVISASTPRGQQTPSISNTPFSRPTGSPVPWRSLEPCSAGGYACSQCAKKGRSNFNSTSAPSGNRARNRGISPGMTRENVTSGRLPGGDLVAALFNREVMALADRGSASNLIGSRWGDLAAEYASTWIGQERSILGRSDETMHVVQVERLDAIPQLAAAASRRSLKHPDLFIVGERNGRPTIQAADAKFSVETARAKQVSPEAVLALRALQHQGLSLLPALDEETNVV